MVLEVSVHDWLAAFQWISGEAEHNGSRNMWQGKLLTSWLLGSRKRQREEEPRTRYSL
jgi:hypothetical protein